ncbi:MAG: hypothetical protein ACKN9T_04010 [Candidatus Methylumidiphilus sp.]
MHRTEITLEDEEYAFLLGEARTIGITIAELLHGMVTTRMRAQSLQADDPLEDLIGIAEGDGSAVGREHDWHLRKSRQA